MVRNCIKCGRFCSDHTYEVDDKLCLDCLARKLVEEWVDRPGTSENLDNIRLNVMEGHMRLGDSEDEAEKAVENAFEGLVKPVIGTYLVWLKRNLAWGYEEDRAKREAMDTVMMFFWMLSKTSKDEKLSNFSEELFLYYKNILDPGTRNSTQAPTPA